MRRRSALPQRNEILGDLERLQRLHVGLEARLQTILDLTHPDQTSGQLPSLEESLASTLYSLVGNFGTLGGAVYVIRRQVPSAQRVASTVLPRNHCEDLAAALAAANLTDFPSKILSARSFKSLRAFPGVAELLRSMKVSVLAPLPLGKDQSAFIILGRRMNRKPFSRADVSVLSVLIATASLSARFAGMMQTNLELQMQRFRVQGLLEEFIAPEVVQQLLSSPRRRATTDRRRVSVLMADIRNFTATSEITPPEVLVRCMNSFYDSVAAVTMRHGGTVDKFIGDAILAVFGAPVAMDDHAQRAVRAGQDMVRIFEELKEKEEEFGEVFRSSGLGVGIATGEVISGSMGSGKRVDYTVIGRTVNLAARITSLAGPQQVVFDETTRADLGDSITFSTLPSQLVKGIGEKVALFEAGDGSQE